MNPQTLTGLSCSSKQSGQNFYDLRFSLYESRKKATTCSFGIHIKLKLEHKFIDNALFNTLLTSVFCLLITMGWTNFTS